MKELDILYNHYNDTFSILKEKEGKRDKLFMILFLLIMLLFLFSINQNSIYEMIRELVKNQINVSLTFEFNIILSFLWIVLFYSTIRYFQTVVHINRGYEYLHSIERDIDKKIEFKFEREGKSYLDEYPILLEFIYQMYIKVFPILYCIIVYYKIVLEWQNVNYIFNNILNTIMATLIIIVTTFYFFALHPKLIKKVVKYIKINDG